MGNRLYLVLILATVPICAAHGASSDGAEPAGLYTEVDAILTAAASSVQRMQECKKLTGLLKADLNKKESELSAEFGGRIPHYFGIYLNNRHKRVNKQDALCIADVALPAEQFRKAHDALRGIEPSSLPGIEARQKKLAKMRLTYNQLITPAKKDKQ